MSLHSASSYSTTTNLPCKSSGKHSALHGHQFMRECKKVGAALQHAHCRHRLALRTPTMSQNTQTVQTLALHVQIGIIITVLNASATTRTLMLPKSSQQKPDLTCYRVDLEVAHACLLERRQPAVVRQHQPRHHIAYRQPLSELL